MDKYPNLFQRKFLVNTLPHELNRFVNIFLRVYLDEPLRMSLFLAIK